MTNIVVKIICAAICAITLMHLMKTMLDKEYKPTKKNQLLLIAILTIITYFSYQVKYSGESGILKLVLYIIAFKFLTRQSIYKITITLLITIAILSISDLMGSLVLINWVTIEQVRGIWYYILPFNIIVCGATIMIINITPIKNKLKNFIFNLNDRSRFSTLFLLTASIVVILYVLYNISMNFQWSEQYFINLLIAVTYIIIILIFFKDRNEYNNLMIQYDCLFDYFKELENSIDEISLNNHEYKNQLAVLKQYIERNKKKDAIKYINDMGTNINSEDQMVASQLKNIPKGGIKGLLYYKIIVAKNKKISIVLDISKNVTKNLKQLTYEENKVLSKVLGVYIDNAIDEIAKMKKKVLTLEIYNMDSATNIVISNKFRKDQVKIEKISQKGYSTKGTGHGKGLYLINKIINKEKWFTVERRIIDDYYIQKIVILPKKNY